MLGAPAVAWAAPGTAAPPSGSDKWSCRVVVWNEDFLVGPYLGEDTKRYQVGPDEWVEKRYVKLRTRSAAKGEGSVCLTCQGSANVRQQPTTESPVVFSWPVSNERMKKYKQALGLENGWVKVSSPDGKWGYVRGDLVKWIPNYYWEIEDEE